MNGNWFPGFRSFAEAGFLATLALASAGVKFMTQRRDSEPSFSERLILFTRFPIPGKAKTRDRVQCQWKSFAPQNFRGHLKYKQERILPGSVHVANRTQNPWDGRWVDKPCAAQYALPPR